MIQQVVIGFQYSLDRTGIQPDVNILGPHPCTAFDHNIDGIGHEILAIVFFLETELFFKSRDQCLSIFEEITTNDSQGVMI